VKIFLLEMNFNWLEVFLNFELLLFEEAMALSLRSLGLGGNNR
jgi:hypothetical protein